MKTSIKSRSIISLAIVLGFSVLFLVNQPTFAVSAQSTTNSSAIFGTPSQSNFQGAGFQQTGGTNTSNASGGAAALKQPANGSLTVTGAPATQATTTESQPSGKFWLIVIFVTSGIGLLLLYFYTKRINAQQAVAETELASEVIQETIDQAKPKAKKDSTKKKKKKKKHHR